MAKSSTPRKPRAPAPTGETKAAKFSRLASIRVTKIVKAIKNVGNLSTSGYEYTPEQVAKIEAVIKDALKASMTRFDKSAAKVADSVQI